MTEIPISCRECGKRVRTFNTFRCPVCHSNMTPKDHPRLAHVYLDRDPGGLEVVTEREDNGWLP